MDVTIGLAHGGIFRHHHHNIVSGVDWPRRLQYRTEDHAEARIFLLRHVGIAFPAEASIPKHYSVHDGIHRCTNVHPPLLRTRSRE